MKILQLLVVGLLAAGAAHAEEQCLVSQSSECSPKTANRKTSSTPEVNLASYRAPHDSNGLDSTAIVSGRHATVHREASVLFPVAHF